MPLHSFQSISNKTTLSPAGCKVQYRLNNNQYILRYANDSINCKKNLEDMQQSYDIVEEVSIKEGRVSSNIST